MNHKTVDIKEAQEGCRICAADLLKKYYESRLTDIERLRLEEVVHGN